MKILLSKKYLTFPVNINTVSKKVFVTEGDALLFDFDCKVDMLSPHFTAYIDVSRFAGKTVEIGIEPEMEFAVGTADEAELPAFGHEVLRPQVHFTVRNGWNNDPNGLIFYEGNYHMFYQFNPAAPEWGNMQWGHAVSSDLLHWEQKGTVLFPDAFGRMFSGSAIEDTDNVSGLKCNEHNPLLLFYTAAPDLEMRLAGKKHCQCLAYSTDGGRTFEKYKKNPIVDWVEAGNRDPKVVFVPELQKYLMIFYLDGNRYCMMTSGNLLDWENYGELSIADNIECPDLFRLECEGRQYWVITGPRRDTYLVGSFTESGFVPLGEEKPLSHGGIAFAAQSFSGLPAGEVVRIAWLMPGISGMPFTHQMSFPMRISLKKIGDSFYLAGEPHENIRLLRRESQCVKNTALLGKQRFEIGAQPAEVFLDMPYPESTRLKLTLFGREMTVDTDRNQISFGNTKMPIGVLQDRIKLRLVIDRCTLECYADGGIFCFAEKCLCDYNLPYIELSSEKEVPVDLFACHTLKSMYEKGETV